MPIQVDWDTEAKQAIRYDFVGHWNWTDFRHAITEGYKLIASVDYPVDSISHFHPGTKIPAGAFVQFRNAQQDAPSNLGLVIIVGTSMLVSRSVTLFGKLYRKLESQLRVVDTLEEARTIIMERAHNL
jgi:hypothetical protein